MSIITPAVLPSSREDLKEKLALLGNISSISRIQIDVVDGKFATPASWPYIAPEELGDMVASGDMLPNLHRVEYEIDLMCLDPREAAEAWLALGASRLTFHAESTTDIRRLISFAHTRLGCGPVSCGLVPFGLALNIESDLSLIEPYFDQIDYVQFMGVARIGRQGQPFDRRVLEKIRIFHARYPKILIQVDGGVSLETAKELLARGVSQLVVGSAILRATDPSIEMMKFESLQNSYGV